MLFNYYISVEHTIQIALRVSWSVWKFASLLWKKKNVPLLDFVKRHFNYFCTIAMEKQHFLWLAWHVVIWVELNLSSTRTNCLSALIYAECCYFCSFHLYNLQPGFILNACNWDTEVGFPWIKLNSSESKMVFGGAAGGKIQHKHKTC